MDIKQLEKTLNREPSFRLKQAQKAVFQDLIDDWGRATVFSLALREKLKREVPLEIAAKLFVAADQKTVKSLIGLADGLKVEAVLMRYPKRNTVCVSSMVGCPLNCEFCATGKMGFKRNLSDGEIVEQVLFFNRYLKKSGQRVNSLVFMGMGEPFLNCDSVFSAVEFFNRPESFNIGARHISISTVGIIEGIKKLTQSSLPVNLAISLHAADDETRSKIMPINRRYPLREVLEAVEEYLQKTRRKVMFEYIMIRGINDSLNQAQKLVRLLSGLRKSLYLVNLIAYNPTGIFKPSSSEQIQGFKKVLEKQGIEVTERYRFGRQIQAACGQLAIDDEE
ncbi:MAG: 23S rRNA (adenine(2503)-C(2))-methyltransferase RlmN [Candidatus Nealsonbacteria bacterium]|nr:23S rRNA (adenine(2503)-C(2))-methyltransferase RlmN [Candidatus Nealsonbacteria bacterium]